MLINQSLSRACTAPEPGDVHSPAFLESVLNASRDCIKVLTLDGELVFMNSGGQAVMEVDDFEKVRGCFWPSLWEGEHNGAAVSALASAKAGQPSHFIGQASTMKGNTKWWDVTVTPIMGDDRALTHIMSMSRDITAARELELQRELLAGELIHRVKNVLAVVGAIANQSFRNADPGHLDAFSGRLSALGDAQGLLIAGAVASATIKEVVTRAASPHCSPDRCTISGPAFDLDAKRVLALSMAVHELATNAIKYGALANDTGRIAIDWTMEAGSLIWTWRESFVGMSICNICLPGLF